MGSAASPNRTMSVITRTQDSGVQPSGVDGGVSSLPRPPLIHVSGSAAPESSVIHATARDRAVMSTVRMASSVTADDDVSTADDDGPPLQPHTHVTHMHHTRTM